MSDPSASQLTVAHLTALSSFLAKYDAKDKLTGLVQYGAMFLADGEAGTAKNVQLKVAGARKIFRVLNETNPVKALMAKPGLGEGPMVLEMLEKAKLITFAGYCVGNHLAFAGDVGLIKDKEFATKAQRGSLYGWCLTSLCTALIEAYKCAQLVSKRRADEDEDKWQQRKIAAMKELQSRLVTITHMMSMVVLSLGILGRLPLRQRTMGALGVFSSALSCYKMYPAIQSPKPKTA